MSIHNLKITNLRNIAQAGLQFGPGLNLIHGDNGSGKSTLLEAIYLLARGRSYRTSRFGSVIKKGETSTILFAKTRTDREHRIGLEKTPSKTRVKVDGQEVDKLSEIARITPLQIITPMSHEILERGPEYRRRFLEWGVFHVEHTHFSLYRQFNKILRQRNSAIREQNQALDAWDSALVDKGEQLNQLRSDYFDNMIGKFATHAERLGLEPNLDFNWKSGWKRDVRYADALKQSRALDLERGFTNYGPHRADFSVQIDGRSAFNSASRGQQKMIIVALHLAQASIAKERLGIVPILLIDDLVSELDQSNRNRLLNHLDSLKSQVFVTSTDNINRSEFHGAAGFRIAAGVPSALD